MTVMKQPPRKEKNKVISGIYESFLESESAIKRFLRRFLYKSEDIEEIAQETFLRAYKATQGREIDSPKAYLFQVARSLAYGELSRKSRKLTDYLEEAVETDAQHSDQLEDEYAAQQKISLYFEAIAELPPQCRRVFLMRKVQAMPYKSIAQQLEISVSAVEQHIALGSRRCKHYLDTAEATAVMEGAAVFESTAVMTGGETIRKTDQSSSSGVAHD
jgi:RNA polymerase sigma factor (sigma-70 family)